MGRGRSTLILLAIALGLGAYLYFVDSKRPVEDENARRKVFSYETDNITQLEIRSSTGEVTALRKGDNRSWTIVKPTEAPADSNSAMDVAATLASLEEDRVVEENAADLKTYGLAEPRIEATFHVEGEKEPRRLLIGDKTPTNTGVYAKLGNDNRVFIAGTSIETALDKKPFDFRDKAALKIEQDKVTSIELASREQTMRLEKKGDDWHIVKPLQAPADFVAVNGILGQLQSAQMTSIEEGAEALKDLKQYGLETPQLVATLGMGDATAVLQIGGPTDGPGGVWARTPARQAVFSLNSTVADELRKTVDDVRRKDVFEFRPFNTTRFEITAGGQTRAFERVKGAGENAPDTWKQVAPKETPVDSSNFEGALLDFSNMRAESFADRAGAATGHNAPAATIVVRFDDGKKEERVVIGTTAAGAFAVRPDQPGAMKIEPGKFEEAFKKLEAVAAK